MASFNYRTTVIGKEYKTEYEITDRLAKKFLQSLYIEDEESWQSELPYSIFLTYHVWNNTIGNPVPGTIHLKQKNENFKRAKIGDRFEVTVKVKDKYQSKGRDYLILETSFNKEGTLYCIENTTYLWGFANG
ncbi:MULTISPECIES: hypothetical protein [Bhargavaea]|uniref:MaoC like domain-containing protein n=1 Tax=Bhargavaea changchunensis TaxID=2134037 RepID=A0ABW2NE60_9BACL|nr:hypothetical protein [Bhargavaea sp. CC-171006]